MVLVARHSGVRIPVRKLARGKRQLKNIYIRGEKEKTLLLKNHYFKVMRMTLFLNLEKCSKKRE